ncbi:hypothetical protein OPV22_014779 [Ensete ventricosum]|uniref:BTB domain-containing protein n=1 Tax=Ensete ventricosum TaxID=4639 RepID=A0AAV8PKX3_ENSVE|nr:hypothetical protein OPV22_014779 [Ensete ventricosum]
MEATRTFCESNVTSGGSLCSAAPVAAEVAALSRLSDHLRSLLRTPGLAFCSDARITVRSAGGDPPHEVPVHRCVLSARSPFFLYKFAAGAGAGALELGELVAGFEVGYEALEVVLRYVYTDMPINSLRLLQQRLLDILEKVAMNQVLSILFVANLNYKLCQRLFMKVIDTVVNSDISYITLQRKLPSNVVKKIKRCRSNLGLDGQENFKFPDKHVKSIYGVLDTDDIELVKLLLEEGRTTLDDAMALHYAVAYCDSKFTKELLDLGLVDVNSRDHQNYIVLHLAAMRKDPEIIMSLLTMEAQPLEITSMEEQRFKSPRGLPDLQTIYYRLSRYQSSDNLHEKLLYLESRVWLAELLFPTEAKTAMDNANVDGTLKVDSSCLTHLCAGNKRSAEDVVKASFRMTEEYLSQTEALTKTVQLGMHCFPWCSKVIDKILGDDLFKLPIVKHINTEERKNRYKEILEELEEQGCQKTTWDVFFSPYQQKHFNSSEAEHAWMR